MEIKVNKIEDPNTRVPINNEEHKIEHIKAEFAKVSDKITVVLDGNIYDLMMVSSVVVILGATTVAIEALALGKPIYSYPAIGETTSKYVDMGIAYPFRNFNNKGHEPLPDNHNTILEHMFYKIDGHVVDRCIHEINKLLEG